MADVSYNEYSREFTVSDTVELTFDPDEVMEHIPTKTIKDWIEDSDVTDYFTASAVAACFEIEDVIAAYKERGEEVPGDESTLDDWGDEALIDELGKRKVGIFIDGEVAQAFRTLTEFFRIAENEHQDKFAVTGMRFVLTD